ncbi:MAG: serine/threonine-protein kinase [Aureliella sp.]
MNSDYTQQQSLDGLQQSEKLSLQTTVPPADVPGYTIESLLGAGAFGQVWLGVDQNTGRQVAIKFYLHRSGVDFSLLRREVKHLINMSTGRYIVQVLNVGWDADPAYYVMEYLENGSLEDLVRARGALSFSETVTMIREIADGLSFAHSKGVLHCDLKPANVVLDHDLRPRLADFGQSRMSDDQTPSLGTLFYMAPEQADLEAAPDAAWDVYALGAICYTMLVGSPPYRTADIVETLDTAASLPDRLTRYRETIQNAPRPKLHYRRKGIDKGLCQIVDRCLAVAPEKRYQNVQQVIEAIDSWDRARTRRPLYIMGIVGPIVLLLLMMLFSARSTSVANQIALSKVQQRSVESNELAAMFASRMLEKEIESLFRLVESETQSAELRDLLTATVEANEEIIAELKDPSTPEKRREPFLQDPTRQKLEAYLSERIQAIVAQSATGGNAAIFDSVFVNQSDGVNVAISFADTDTQATTPVGGNYAYRSYFTGEPTDGARTVPRHTFSPTRTTSLSASFRSTSTGKYKIGVSAPIWADPAVAEGKQPPAPLDRPLGVLVITINLGDFELLRDESGEIENRFAILVDGRDGPQKGRLLHHPLLQNMDAEQARDIEEIPQINELALDKLRDGTVSYSDPAANLDPQAEFEGEWIAAMSQVHLPRSPAAGLGGAGSGGRTMSDLWVLVQERGSSVSGPLEALGARLQWETFMELLALLAAIGILWFFVLRLNAFSRNSAPGYSTGSSRKTGFSSSRESGS